MDLRGKGFGWLGLAKGALICLCAGVVANGRAEGVSFDSAGTRFGLGVSGKSKDFYEAEAFAVIKLPWSWDLGREFRLASGAEACVGWLGERGNDAAIGEAGPLFVLSHKQFPVTLAGGSNAAGLSRSEFETKDIGTKFQISSHIGLNWDFAAHFRLGYRYEHISNGGLEPERNPGINLHVFELSYLF
jgi:hypothetical protein